MRVLLMLAIASITVTAHAQAPVQSWDPAMVGMSGVMNHGVREAARRGQLTSRSSASSSSANARRICANKRAHQARLDPGRAGRLGALCAKAGY